MTMRALPFLLLAACGSSRSASSSEGATCEELQSAARDEVAKAIDNHSSCDKDADCIEVGLSAKCFDSCSRLINASGAAEVVAAQDRVNNAQCQQAGAKACKVVIPPCAPPRTPTCKAGTCR
jgi:hypothetical protein